MKVSIITPEQLLLHTEAISVSVPGQKAPFTMLDRHQAIISSLVPDGIVTIKPSGGQVIQVHIEGSCMVEQHDNQVTILADRASTN